MGGTSSSSSLRQKFVDNLASDQVCTGETITVQTNTCDFDLDHCDNATVNCLNSSKTVYTCSLQSVAQAVAKVKSKASASVQKGFDIHFGSDSTNSSDDFTQVVADKLSSLCSSKSVTKQDLKSLLKCTDSKDAVFNILNQNEPETECAIASAISIIDDVDASAKSKYMGLSLNQLTYLIIAVIVLLIVGSIVYARFQEKK